MGRQAQSSGGKPATSARANAAGRAAPGVPAQRSEPPAPVHLSDLYRGFPRLGLIRDLAFGEFSHAEIARTLGCKAADIAEFAAQNEEDIAEVRAALAGQLAIETAGLWIAKKQNRLAEYQSDVEDLIEAIETLRSEGQLGSPKHREVLKSKTVMLKAVADELAPRGVTLRQSDKSNDDKNVVHYVIEDPDAEAMT